MVVGAAPALAVERAAMAAQQVTATAVVALVVPASAAPAVARAVVRPVTA
jgi:hypothetical protein